MTQEQFSSAKKIEQQINAVSEARESFSVHFPVLMGELTGLLTTQDSSTRILIETHAKNWEVVMIADLNHRIQSLKQQFSEL